jgi:hypothetical protein
MNPYNFWTLKTKNDHWTRLAAEYRCGENILCDPFLYGCLNIYIVHTYTVFMSILVLDIKEFQGVDVFFCPSRHHVCSNWSWKGVLGAGLEAGEGLMGEGTLKSTAWDWCGGKFTSFHGGFTAQARALSFFTTATQVIIIHYTWAPLQVKNKPHDRVRVSLTGRGVGMRPN